jgi:2-hydroxychromene-2-carboxylate isomerase
LRVVCSFQDEPAVLGLAVGLADACWGGGRPLTDPDVLEKVTAAAGFDAQDLERRISRPEIKGRLRENTETAVGHGVFGVPTFLHGGQLYWGHDRLSHLADHLEGKGPDEVVEAGRMLDRPRGADRRRRN